MIKNMNLIYLVRFRINYLSMHTTGHRLMAESVRILLDCPVLLVLTRGSLISILINNKYLKKYLNIILSILKNLKVSN